MRITPPWDGSIMKTLCIRLMIVLVALTVPGMVSAEKVLATGDRLVAIRLPTPETSGKRACLGIAESDSFDPTTITGSLLVIEIFSTYCPFCQREAPAVNRLFGAIEASDTLRGRV